MKYIYTLMFFLFFSVSSAQSSVDLNAINTLVQNDGQNCLIMMDVTNFLKTSPLPVANDERKKELLHLAKKEYFRNEEIKQCLNLKTSFRIVTFSSYDEYGKAKIDSLNTLIRFSVNNELIKKLTEQTPDEELETIFFEDTNPKK